jgi:predicted aspartyl protease
VQDALHMAGKRGQGGQVSATPPLRLVGGILVLRDEISGEEFLVDTGAEVSVIPLRLKETASLSASGPRLRAANGSDIKSYGTCRRTIMLDGERYRPRFVLAEIDKCILGADFLTKEQLLVDVFNGQLVKPGPWSTVRGQWTEQKEMCKGLRAVTQSSPFVDLMEQYPALIKFEISLPPVQHEVEHVLQVTGRPFRLPFRNLSAEKLAAAKKEFESLLKLGVCRRGRGQWASPLHMVSKADKTWRPCGDYMRLNQQTVHDSYPLP